MTSTPSNKLAGIALLIAVISLAVSAFSLLANRPSQAPLTGKVESSSLLSTIQKEKVIRAGYGVFPPFTDEDPRTGRVSGVSVDIVEEVAKQVGARVEWRRLNWNTMSADLRRGAYDVVADPIFQNPARAREFTFSEPYSYFSIGLGVVRRQDTRFAKFEDINRPGVRIAVGQGFGEEAFVRARAPRANIIAVPAGQDSAIPMNSVLTGRADIAITNLADGERVVSAHPDRLKLLWADSPPAFVPAGFAFRLGDRDSADFLNVALRNLRSGGVLNAIAARHDAAVQVTEPQGLR